MLVSGLKYSIPAISSKMCINSRVSAHICCFSMCFVIVYCLSLKRDKCTGLTYIYVAIYHCMQYVTVFAIIAYCTGMHTCA